MTQSLSLRRPDDWHVHLRDGAMLRMALPATARVFGRAIVMPNLSPPVTSRTLAAEYRQRILQNLPADARFEPLMTCYLTDVTDPDDVDQGFAAGAYAAAKLYPANSTTNAAAGVTDVRNIYDVLERMQAIGMPLLVHGEVTDPGIDIFDREKAFIDTVLEPLKSRFRDLKTVFEHITTRDAVQYVRSADDTVAATITVHHLMINRNAMFVGGIRPHMYCLPVAKRELHRAALREAATSGDNSFFLGTDSAPHLVTDKESACGCAGIFTAPTAMELYAQVFDEEQALDKLERFASLHGPRFYGLEANEERITLNREDWRPAEFVDVEPAGQVATFAPTGTLRWRVAAD